MVEKTKGGARKEEVVTRKYTINLHKRLHGCTFKKKAPLHQLEVKNALLHGDLSETVYMSQPLGFRDSTHPNYGTTNAYLILYVDDILLTTSSETLLQQIISSLHHKFSMTDLGSLNYFLSISVTCDSSGMLLSQHKYAIEILERAHMDNCNPSRTPVDTESKLGDNVAYSDADWASCPTTRRSASGYRVFLGNNLLSWSSKRQPTLSRFSAEAEYCGVANAVVETCWLRNLLHLVATGQVRILQKSKENGQNRTITDTGTELSVQKPGECYQRANDWKNDWPGLMGVYNRLRGLEASPRQYKYKQGLIHKIERSRVV
ncbi:ribonuclease H-like domain-containing protein [Tanacetum coccineum]